MRPPPEPREGRPGANGAADTSENPIGPDQETDHAQRNNGPRLSVPDVRDSDGRSLDNLSAALRYAAAGFPVLPSSARAGTPSRPATRK
jgi:hypothetical protein